MKRGGAYVLCGVAVAAVAAGIVWAWKRARPRDFAQDEDLCKFDKGHLDLQKEMTGEERQAFEHALDQIATFVDNCDDLGEIQRLSVLMADAIMADVGPEQAAQEMRKIIRDGTDMELVRRSGLSGCETFIATIRKRHMGGEATARG